MKKLLLGVFVVFSFVRVNAQEFKAGVSVGLPVSDASDFYTVNADLDLTYLWNVSQKFDVGITTGVSYNFGDTVRIPNIIGGGSRSFDVDDAVFIPIAGAVRFALSEKFSLGMDLGYAIGVSPSRNDGGFYYAPRVQYSVTDKIDIVFAYRSVEIPVGLVGFGYLDNISLGVEMGL